MITLYTVDLSAITLNIWQLLTIAATAYMIGANIHNRPHD